MKTTQHLISYVLLLLIDTGKTVVLYICTTLIAAILAILMSVLFQRWYQAGPEQEDTPTYVTLGCGGDHDAFLMRNADGTVNCTSSWDEEQDILWSFGDVNGTFVTTNGAAVADISLSDTIYEYVEFCLPSHQVRNFSLTLLFAFLKRSFSYTRHRQFRPFVCREQLCWYVLKQNG